jgi:polyvinyl alcohol dehydrogenase (cytochrome)
MIEITSFVSQSTPEVGCRRLRTPLAALLPAIVMTAALPTAALADKPDWPMFGRNVANTASTVQSGITISNVSKLKPKWTFTTGGDVSARAAVVNGVAYFPDWGGNLWAVNANNGKLIWGHQISDYIPGATSGSIVSRTSPAVVNGVLYVGTQKGANLLAIDAKTGTLLWKTALGGSDNYAIVTSSPAVYNGVVYTGVASIAEGASLVGITLSATTARGSAVAVKAANGQIIWQTYMVPAISTGGAGQGAGVWGSNPVVDVANNQLVVGTGNNYTVPTTEDGNYEDSIVAIDLISGKMNWHTKLVTWTQGGVASGSDSFNADCLFPLFGAPQVGPQCPIPYGPDYDFGSAPNLITYQTASGSKTIIGAGQKSGIYYALNPADGKVLWQTQVGPGSAVGGMEWGSASDGVRIYVAIANLYGLSNGSGFAGAWAALDPASGTVQWKTADPNGAVDIGPMTVADGVVYASSMAKAPNAPTMFALNAATGQPVWNFVAGASVNAGATVVNGIVYWGSGYGHLGFPEFTGGTNKFYAFSVNGN